MQTQTRTERSLRVLTGKDPLIAGLVFIILLGAIVIGASVLLTRYMGAKAEQDRAALDAGVSADEAKRSLDRPLSHEQ